MCRYWQIAPTGHLLVVYEQELAFQLALALDPRWKLAWCDTPEEATSLKIIVHQKVLAIVPPSTPPPESAADSPPPQKRSCYFNFMKDTQSVSCEADVELQVGEYFSTPCLHEDANPLAFWKSHQQKTPRALQTSLPVFTNTSIKWTS